MTIHHASPQVSLAQLFNLKSVVWDFDGVFYSYDHLPDRGFYRLCDEASAAAANELFGIEQEEATKMAKEGYAEYNDGLTIFAKHAQKESAGVDLEEVKLKFHRLLHAHLLKIVKHSYATILTRNHSTIDAFDQSTMRDIRHGIVTHGALNEWCIPVINNMGLLPYFQQQAILGYEDFGFNNKKLGTQGLELCMQRLNTLDPRNIAFVEDTLEHLKVAKNRFPALLTVWVNPNLGTQKNDNAPPYVDVVVSEPYHFVNAINQQQVSAHPLRIYAAA